MVLKINPVESKQKELKGDVMKIMIHIGIVLFLFVNVALMSCSKSLNEDSEKGTIETMTQETAHEIVHRIQTPINNARALQDEQEDRLDAMEDSMKEQ